MSIHSNRRTFLRQSAAASIGLSTLGIPRSYGAVAKGKLRVLSIGVVGTIGKADRTQVASHPDAEIVGLCDVDSVYLAEAAKDHPDAFTCKDYREAFEKYGDAFDAVIVSVPDHTHAPIILTAMANDKHVYGQKPLVHQLAELTMIEQALAAKPKLVTQLGNQRMAHPGRRAAVDILSKGLLGKTVKAYCWTNSPGDNRYFNYNKIYQEAEAPEQLDYNLWLGPCQEMPYYENLVPERFRSWWDFGTNGLGDWGCHLLDVILLSYEELTSPVSVKTDCAEPAGKVFHVNPCKSTITYQVDSAKFADKTFPLHFYDCDQAATPEQMHIPEPVKGSNMTVVVCEGGTLVLQADGRLAVWRDGKEEQGMRIEGIPRKYASLNHWHAWVDNCLGRDTPLLTPFADGIRITEPALLAVKATRFPGQELQWDYSTLSFPNHPEATKTLVHRQYREGFAPPRIS